MQSMPQKPRTVRERYPTVTVSVGRAEQRELVAAAARRGFESERGVLAGGLVRAILRRLWPYLRSVEWDPSRCDISAEHAWLLAEMRALREREPRRWAVAMATLADVSGQRMPAEVARVVDGLLPASGGAKVRGGQRHG